MALSATGFWCWEPPARSLHYQPRQEHRKKPLAKAGPAPSCRASVTGKQAAGGHMCC